MLLIEHKKKRRAVTHSENRTAVSTMREHHDYDEMEADDYEMKSVGCFGVMLICTVIFVILLIVVFSAYVVPVFSSALLHIQSPILWSLE